MKYIVLIEKRDAIYCNKKNTTNINIALFDFLASGLSNEHNNYHANDDEHTDKEINLDKLRNYFEKHKIDYKYFGYVDCFIINCNNLFIDKLNIFCDTENIQTIVVKDIKIKIHEAYSNDNTNIINPSNNLWCNVSAKTTEYLENNIHGSDIVIGIISSGVDIKHPHLKNNFSGIWHDYVNKNNTPYDDNGTGTNICGVICGDEKKDKKDKIITGIATKAQWGCYKIFDSFGMSNISLFVEICDHILYKNYNISALCCGFDLIRPPKTHDISEYEFLINKMTQIMEKNKILMCFSAGNFCNNFSDVFTIGAYDYDMKMQHYNNPKIIAPGIEILVCIANNKKKLYDIQDGNILACAYTCGCVAMIIERLKNLNINYDVGLLKKILTGDVLYLDDTHDIYQYIKHPTVYDKCIVHNHMYPRLNLSLLCPV